MHTLTRRADQVIKLAKELAREFGQGYVGTEHLLLGIVREGTSLAAKTLVAHGAAEPRLREEVERLLKDRLQETWVMGRWPGTPHFRDVLSKAAEEARGRGNWQIGSVHLLLALLTEKGSMGYNALLAIGLSPDTLRKALLTHQPASSP